MLHYTYFCSELSKKNFFVEIINIPLMSSKIIMIWAFLVICVERCAMGRFSIIPTYLKHNGTVSLKHLVTPKPLNLFFSVFTASFFFFTPWHKMVNGFLHIPNAYIHIFTNLWTSLMYIKNKTGPGIKSWGSFLLSLW